jgi:hypothetical protein
MKGPLGITIAVSMGVVGLVCNWLYLQQQAGDYKRVSFVGVDQNATINQGDVFKNGSLKRIDVPRNSLGDLREVAVPWNQKDLVIGQKATRSFGLHGTEILTWKDLAEPPTKNLNQLISAEERVMWLPVDSRSFNPQHVNPGDEVSFRIPRFGGEGSSRNKPLVGGGEIIGPFKILALGDRKGSPDVHSAAGLSAGAENILAIAVKVDASGKLEARAQKLSDTLQVNSFQGVQILLHADKNRP